MTGGYDDGSGGSGTGSGSVMEDSLARGLWAQPSATYEPSEYKSTSKYWRGRKLGGGHKLVKSNLPSKKFPVLGDGGTSPNSNHPEPKCHLNPKSYFFIGGGGYIAQNQNVTLTQNPTKIPFELENHRFLFHSI